ncbi:unnamed protein product [Amoebophrya sp. A25]|nr:unnamed protein product [Amoebophrya sp. A25]|eukprot:GSA25T00024126001.1
MGFTRRRKNKESALLGESGADEESHGSAVAASLPKKTSVSPATAHLIGLGTLVCAALFAARWLLL